MPKDNKVSLNLALFYFFSPFFTHKHTHTERERRAHTVFGKYDTSMKYDTPTQIQDITCRHTGW